MTYPINNSSAGKNPAYGPDGFEDGYDPEMGEVSYGSEGDEFVPPNSEPAPMLSAADLRTAIQDVLAELYQNKDLSSSEKNKFRQELDQLKSQVNSAQALHGERREAKLADIQRGLEDLMAGMSGEALAAEDIPEFGDEEEGSEADAVDLKALKKELRRAISDIESRNNLTDDEKIELKAPLEKHLTEIEIAKKDSGEIDPDSIREDIAETKKATEEQDSYSPGLKGLAEFSGLEPEVIKGKAETKGIDLNQPPSPPTVELMNFLTELSPELEQSFKKIETALNERTKFYQDNNFQATGVSQHNNGSTTNDDIKNLESFQHLFNLKHFQDAKSKDVMTAMQEMVKILLPLFKALYPGEEVKVVESGGVSGWEKIEADYKVADKIQIGGKTVDLVNNKDGKMQSVDVTAGSVDADIEIKIPDIWADGEGDNEWTIPQLQTYGENQAIYNKYTD